jgi:hypothetical protein
MIGCNTAKASYYNVYKQVVERERKMSQNKWLTHYGCGLVRGQVRFKKDVAKLWHSKRAIRQRHCTYFNERATPFFDLMQF